MSNCVSCVLCAPCPPPVENWSRQVHRAVAGRGRTINQNAFPIALHFKQIIGEKLSKPHSTIESWNALQCRFLQIVFAKKRENNMSTVQCSNYFAVLGSLSSFCRPLWQRLQSLQSFHRTEQAAFLLWKKSWKYPKNIHNSPPPTHTRVGRGSRAHSPKSGLIDQPLPGIPDEHRPLGHHTTNADHPHKKYTHKVSPKCSLLENEYIKSFSKLKSQNQAYHALAEVINSNLEL